VHRPAQNPAERYASAADFREALRQIGRAGEVEVEYVERSSEIESPAEEMEETAMFRAPSPSSTGTLRFTPVTGATGTAIITVVVNDGQSLNNTVTRTFTVTVSSSAAQTIYVEAESGVRVSPMTVGSDVNAANGQYVYSTAANAGTVSFPFNSQSGTYWIWCRVFSPDAGRDSLFVSMDGGVEEVFSTAPGGVSLAPLPTRRPS